MTRTDVNLITTILGAIGVLLILAGPAFGLIASTPALFAAIACFVISGAIAGFARRQRRNDEG